MHVDLGRIGGSALTDKSIDGARVGSARPSEGIPVTYVPARNTIMLSLAMAWAEVLDAREIHMGVNAVDYSGISRLPSGIRRGFPESGQPRDQGGRGGARTGRFGRH